ncbi:hypothetical protein [Fictibacillus sp. NRS-1165]|uniref:hypothetical protein n=1 Tax=Fictibacillus sp. NRS-1165 TaxID=3144463 RepID=UPI003D1C4206
MAGRSMKYEFRVGKTTTEYFTKKAPEKLREARSRAVQAAGMVWADETKSVTREDGHIDTSLYVNSIGYVTDYPDTNKSGKGKRVATEEDVVYELSESDDQSRLIIGSNVEYAEILEKRYNLMARGLDRAEDRMRRVAETQIHKTLFGK